MNNARKKTHFTFHFYGLITSTFISMLAFSALMLLVGRQEGHAGFCLGQQEGKTDLDMQICIWPS